MASLTNQLIKLRDVRVVTQMLCDTRELAECLQRVGSCETKKTEECGGVQFILRVLQESCSSYTFSFYNSKVLTL